MTTDAGGVKPTGRRWYVCRESSMCDIADDSGQIAACEFPEDAAHIIHCVNLHDELVEALRDVESKIVDFEADRINWRPDDFLFRVRRVLAKVKP